MAADNLPSLVDLRAGAILFALAVADLVSAMNMDAARHRVGRTRWNRVPNRLRNFFSANDRAVGSAIRKS